MGLESAQRVLPDSRLLSNPTLGSEIVDWPLPSGGTVRVEAIKVYCANCGKLYGHVPLENCTFQFWLCKKCHEKWGAIVGTFALPDDAFDLAVAYEIRERFGRDVTATELEVLKELNQLGPALEKLERESPYPVPSHPG